MTIFAAAAAGPAAARIRGYSMALWAVGVLAIGAIIGLTAFSVAVVPGGDSVYSWESDNPLAATTTDGGTTWSAEDSAYIEVPASLGDTPLVITLTAGGPYATVGLSGPGATTADGYPPLVAVLTIDKDGVPVASTPGSRLWVTSELSSGAEGPWTVTLTPLPVTDLDDGETAGSGNVDLRYSGSATTATLTQTGTGLLAVEVITPTTEPEVLTAVDASTLTVAWSPGESVVLRIRSESTTASWTVTVGSAAAGAGE